MRWASSGSYDQQLHEQQQRQQEILTAAERLQQGAAGSASGAPPRRRPRWLAFLWPFGRPAGSTAGSGGSDSSSSLSGSSQQGGGLPPPSPFMRRSGSELFDRPSGAPDAGSAALQGLLSPLAAVLGQGLAICTVKSQELRQPGT
jgi:hypothetical protein